MDLKSYISAFIKLVGIYLSDYVYLVSLDLTDFQTVYIMNSNMYGRLNEPIEGSKLFDLDSSIAAILETGRTTVCDPTKPLNKFILFERGSRFYVEECHMAVR